MTLKNKLIDFFNNNVKEYDTELYVLENSKINTARKITKEENTLLVVDHLLSILEDYKGEDTDNGKESIIKGETQNT